MYVPLPPTTKTNNSGDEASTTESESEDEADDTRSFVVDEEPDTPSVPIEENLEVENEPKDMEGTTIEFEDVDFDVSPKSPKPPKKSISWTDTNIFKVASFMAKVLCVVFFAYFFADVVEVNMSLVFPTVEVVKGEVAVWEIVLVLCLFKVLPC